MLPNSRQARLATYNTVAVHGGVASADPHGMVLILLDAATERLAAACGCIEHKKLVRKSKLLHSCVAIVAELRGSLNLAQGGPLAQNLDGLYEYMIRQLMLANLNSDASTVAEVLGLLGEIRSAWMAIGPTVRAGATDTGAARGA
ncbi:MAG TPA: flagellar export chaperone FliS [Steroidobacteraceae bacterium]|nr:flagellar export chaperone FliS [Steroidobacteraceae bacterium]